MTEGKAPADDSGLPGIGNARPFDQVLMLLQLDLIRRTAPLAPDPRPAARAVLAANLRAIERLGEAVVAAAAARRVAQQEVMMQPLRAWLARDQNAPPDGSAN